MCEIADRERGDAGRILFGREGVLAFVPFAAQPFEIWIFPPHGDAWVDSGHAPEAAPAPAPTPLAAALSTALRALRDRAGDPDYNLLVHIPPLGVPEELLHWHLRIRPRLLTPAGLELAAGVAVSPLLPEEGARVLAGR